MSEEEQVEYFRTRAADEREMARTAPGELIAGIHLHLASLYEELIRQPHRRGILRAVSGSPSGN